MRIWIINHYALPPTSAGGTRHYNFAKQLMQRGHEVVIMAANYNHFTQTFIAAEQFGKLDHTYDVPFMWIPTPAYAGNTVGRFWNMLVFSWQIQRKKFLKQLFVPDIVIGSSPHLFAAFSAEWLARRFKKPFILEIRDIWPDTLVDLGRFSSKHPLIQMMKIMEKYLYKRAVKIISLLPLAHQYLKQFSVADEDVLSLPNAIDAVTLTSESAPRSCFTFMYAGAHGLANDLDTVVYAAKILEKKKLTQPIQIFLIGEGPHKSHLQALVEKENVSIVKFFDSVAKNKIYVEMDKADAFLMLLKHSPVFRWGISPNKLFDYLLMGKPVIFGVDTPYNPVEQCQAGISVKASDPEALADAMYQMSQLPLEVLQGMGKRGREFVLQKHNVVYLTDLLEELLISSR